MLIYLLKVNVAIAMFYAFYKLLLGRDTFFVWRRVALISFIAVSLILPLLKVEDWMVLQAPVTELSMVYANVVLPEINLSQATESATWQTILMNWGVVIYYVIALILVGRFVTQLLSILFLAKRCEKCMINNVPVYALQKDIAPFSFFKMIFVNPESHSEEELKEILTHEQAHANQYHSIDVIFSELACVVFWYNPFVWLTKIEIRNNLEYMADSRVLQDGYDTKKYQYHLLGLTYQKAAANLYNNFNYLPLKKRIKMMNKKRTNEIGRVKYLLLLPLVAMLLIGNNMNAQANATSQEESQTEKKTVQSSDKEEIKKVVEVMPKFPGGEAALMKFLMENVRYPQEAKEKNVQGAVIASFVVQADGSVGTVKIVKSVDPLLDAEAVRVLKSLPKFEPGKTDGKPVSVWYTLPIRFGKSIKFGK